VRQHAGKLVIVGCVGVAIGWFGRGILGDDSEQGIPADQKSAHVASRNPSAGALPGSSVAAAPYSPTTRIQSVPVSVKANNSSEVPTQDVNSAGKAVGATPITTDSRTIAGVSGTPSNKDALPDSQAAKATPAEALLNAGAIKCDFSQGNSGFWQNQALTVGTAAWQGGPIMYDSINLAAGTARMTGTAALTGSVTDGANVTAVATNSALHLYGVASNGTLSSTTIFGAARNAAGHYNAVMSYHGPGLHNDQESAQFYGTCDTTG
jgi:hypothetical protein